MTTQNLPEGTAPAPHRADARGLAPDLSPGTAPATAPRHARDRAANLASPTAPTLATPSPRAPAPLRRAALAALAVSLSFGTAPARAAPPDPATARPASERDLAYEQGTLAEEAGDHARAADAYERAYRLTLAVETGPRLLFLRASVAARLRADDGTPAARAQLCRAQALLRSYLDEAGGPATEEHAALGRVDQRLATPGPDCAALLAPPPAPASPPAARPTVPAPRPAPGPGPAAVDPAPPRRTPQDRALLASGGVVLGLGVAAFAVMGAGIAVARGAERRGLAECQSDVTTCDAYNQVVLDIRNDGALGNRLTRIGAVTGGLAVLVGVGLIVVGERLRRRPGLAVTPHPGPGELGLGLAARF